jgi:hypothetical protein
MSAPPVGAGAGEATLLMVFMTILAKEVGSGRAAAEGVSP